jgi:hypothetical protein
LPYSSSGSIWLRAWGNYVKHLKKLPLCVFGGYLISMYSLLRKEEESYTYYSRMGGKFMLTYLSVRSMPLLKIKCKNPPLLCLVNLFMFTIMFALCFAMGKSTEVMNILKIP